MKFFIATKNGHKVEEFKRIFEPLGIETVSEGELVGAGQAPEPEETGKTFSENALIKARAGCLFSGLPTVADDTGLCVAALSGAPGIYSARYAGVHGDSAANNEKLLKELKGVPESERGAYFECAVACVFPDGREFVVTGRCDGKIAEEAAGNGGFGYDCLFISEVGRFSLITGEKKDSVSHRGKALKAFSEKIGQYIGE